MSGGGGGIFYLTTPFLYLDACLCGLCEKPTDKSFMTLKISKTQRRCMMTLCCGSCARMDVQHVLTCTPFSCFKHLEALKPWIQKMIRKSEGIPTFITACNKHKNSALKRVSKAIFTVCLFCKTRPSKFRCSHCHYLRFCSAECARSEWFTPNSHHKKHCAAIANAPFIRNVQRLAK